MAMIKSHQQGQARMIRAPQVAIVGMTDIAPIGDVSSHHSRRREVCHGQSVPSDGGHDTASTSSVVQGKLIAVCLFLLVQKSQIWDTRETKFTTEYVIGEYQPPPEETQPYPMPICILIYEAIPTAPQTMHHI